MLKIVKVFFIVILLIFLNQRNCLAVDRPLLSTISLDNHELSPKVRCVEKERVLYINHLLLESLFLSEVDWTIDKDSITVSFANPTFNFQIDKSLLLLNGKKYELSATPFVKEEELWLPLKFFNIIGLIDSAQDDSRLKLAWKDNYLLDVDFVQVHNRPALELVLSGIIEFKHFQLNKPDRLVFEFPSTKVHPCLNPRLTGLKNNIIKKVRYNDNGEVLTLALDLFTTPGYQIFTDPENPRRVLLVFNYFLEDFSLTHHKEEIKVNIRTSSPAEFKIARNDSQSLVIDFNNAIMKTRKKNITGDGELIKDLTVEQIEPAKVRLSLSLLKPEPLYVVPTPNNPNLIQIRKVQLITGLKWTTSAQNSQLVIDGDGEILASITKIDKAKWLQLDLDYAQFKNGLLIPEIDARQIKTVKLDTLNSHRVRLDIDLNYYFDHTLERSSDGRQLRLILKESPLLKQTFMLDPGHGGADNGASGKKGTLEKEVNLEVTLRLKDLLEEAGANVILTRFDDTYISLYERAFLANYLMTDYFISIHTNSHPNSQVNGIEVFYYPNHPQAEPLANKILNALTQQTGLKKLAVKSNNFAVTRETQMAGILVELGFLSNLQEELLLNSDVYKNNAAKGIFQGIVEFLE